MELHQRGFLGRAGISVGHQDGDGFLQGQNIAQLRVVSQRVEKPLLHRARISEHDRQAVCQELLENRVPSGLHSCSG